MVEMNEWGCELYTGVGNLLTLFLFVTKTRGCGLSAVRVIVQKIQFSVPTFNLQDLLKEVFIIQ